MGDAMSERCCFRGGVKPRRDLEEQGVEGAVQERLRSVYCMCSYTFPVPSLTLRTPVRLKNARCNPTVPTASLAQHRFDALILAC